MGWDWHFVSCCFLFLFVNEKGMCEDCIVRMNRLQGWLMYRVVNSKAKGRESFEVIMSYIRFHLSKFDRPARDMAWCIHLSQVAPRFLVCIVFGSAVVNKSLKWMEDLRVLCIQWFDSS